MKRLLILFTIILCATPILAAPRWIPQTSPTSQEVNDVYFFNENDGFAVGNNQVIIKSTDGGRNWSKVSTVTEANNYNLNSIHFPAGQTSVGYAAGTDPFDNGYILKTTNGGQNWNTITAPACRSINRIFFINQNLGWIVTDSYSVTTPATIWQTDNGGSTWNEQVNGILSSDLLIDFYGLFFVNSNTGWVVNEVGRVYKTGDGGNTWIEQHKEDFDLFDIFFSTPTLGWAVGGNGTIIKTADGTSWYKKDSGGSNSLLRSVYFINANQGWAVGNGDTILKTTDGGESWTPESANIIGDLKSVYFIEEDNGWAVGGGGGENSIILKYMAPIVNSVTRHHPTLGEVSWDYQGALRELTVNGKNFISGAVVSFAKSGGTGINLSATTFISSTKLKVNISISSLTTIGSWDVTVTNPDQSSHTLKNGFEIKDASGTGITISNINVEGAVQASAAKKLTKLNPPVTCSLNATNGLSPEAVAFKILIGDPVEYYYDYPGSVLTVNPSDFTKGNIRAILQNLKSFSNDAVSSAYVTLRSPKSFYLYAEDIMSNPARQLYATVYFEGARAGESDITNIIPSPNRNPTPSNPATIQFESREFTGNLNVNIIGLTGIASKTSVTVILGTNQMSFNGTDFNGDLLSSGIYLIYFTDASSVKGKGKLAIQR